MELPDRLLTTQQMAEYLAIPVATLYAWRHAGKGPPGFRVGKHIRYRWSDVDEWVRSQLHSASSLHANLVDPDSSRSLW